MIVFFKLAKPLAPAHRPPHYSNPLLIILCHCRREILAREHPRSMVTAQSPATDLSGPSQATVSYIEIFDSFGAAEPCWRALEGDGAVMTPYQGFDFLSEWHRYDGPQHGVDPFIVTAFDASGTPLFLLPLGVRTVGAVRIAEFMGGKHANFNFPVLRRDVAIAEADLDMTLRNTGHSCDALLLGNQPSNWQGIANPLALLPHQQAPTPAARGGLLKDFDALLRERSNSQARKKMRKKAESLAKHGPITFFRAEGPVDARRMLDAFFAQKQERMKALGIHNIFDEIGVRAWLNVAVAGDRPSIDIYAMSVGGTIVAT
ncbi:MAG: GNAT family N-acetyltransferase, partial [Pseudolabrys sp.]|nr:GNAT family N-acetyltransferase [Pseudolabrys sp.]